MRRRNVIAGYPVKQWPVLVRHLISHTSGIREPDDGAELYNTRHYDRPSGAVALFADDPLRFEPATDFGDTTWGYVLLGCVIEGGAGGGLPRPHARAHLRTAGMRLTRGYILERGELRVARWTDMSHKLAAGGWITTAPDPLRFMDGWMAGRFVDAATRTGMLTPYRLNDRSTVDITRWAASSTSIAPCALESRPSFS